VLQAGNLYVFGINNPVMFVDPSGHSILLASLFLGTLIGFTIGGTVNYMFQGFTRGWNNIDMREVWFNAGLGAITGGLGGSKLAFGLIVAANAAMGATHYLGTQFLRGEDIILIEMFFSMGFGALGGAIGGTSRGFIQNVTDAQMTINLARKLGLQSGQEINRQLIGRLTGSHVVSSMWRTGLINVVENFFDFANGRFFEIGSSGESVAFLQSFLGVNATGHFDRQTERAVVDLQRRLGLQPTGIFDNYTASAIIRLLN